MIICTDDYGLAPGINKAITLLAKEKKISAVSVMIHEEAFLGDIDTLQNEEVDLGLHFCLTLPFYPLTPFKANRQSKEWIRAELQKQWDKFTQLFGHAPQFIDGHQHIQLWPTIGKIMVEFVGKKQKEGIRCYFRASTHQPQLHWKARGLRGWIFDRQTRMLGNLASQNEIQCCESIYGFRSLKKAPTANSFFPLNVPKNPNILFFTHPGLVDIILSSRDSVTEIREKEYSLLQDYTVRPNRYHWPDNRI